MKISKNVTIKGSFNLNLNIIKRIDCKFIKALSFKTFNSRANLNLRYGLRGPQQSVKNGKKGWFSGHENSTIWQYFLAGKETYETQKSKDWFCCFKFLKKKSKLKIWQVKNLEKCIISIVWYFRYRSFFQKYKTTELFYVLLSFRITNSLLKNIK